MPIRRARARWRPATWKKFFMKATVAGGMAMLCEILTDNRNRTAPEIRKIFEMCDGKLGATGCVAWMFERKGLLIVPAEKIEEDKLLEIALEAGADDVKHVGTKFEVACDPWLVWGRRRRARKPPASSRSRKKSPASPPRPSKSTTPQRPARCST